MDVAPPVLRLLYGPPAIAVPHRPVGVSLNQAYILEEAEKKSRVKKKKTEK